MQWTLTKHPSKYPLSPPEDQGVNAGRGGRGGRRSCREGGRGRRGASQGPVRNNANGARSQKMCAFKGDTASMNGHVFQCHGESVDTNQLSVPIEKLLHNAFKNFKTNQYWRYIWQIKDSLPRETGKSQVNKGHGRGLWKGTSPFSEKTSKNTSSVETFKRTTLEQYTLRSGGSIATPWEKILAW